MVLRKRNLLAIAALIVGALVLAYFLFAWLGFEPLVKLALPKVVNDRSGYHLSIEHARFDPLRLAVELQGLALSEPDGKPMLAVQRLFVDIDAASALKRTWLVDEVRVSEPVATVQLRPNGHLNWLDLVDAFSTKSGASSTSSTPPPMRLRRWVLEGGRIELIDDRVSGGFRTQIDPLNIELAHISTLPEDRGDYSLSAQTGIGANVRWKGNLGLNPIAATGELDIDSLHLERVWAYLKSELNMTPPRGDVALKLAYRVSYADRKFNLSLDRVSASIDKLALAGVDDPEPRVALDALRLSGGRFDLASREASVESLTMERGQLAIRLDATGRPEMLNWLAPRAAAAAASAGSAVAPSAAPPGLGAASAPAAGSDPTRWRIGVGRVGVDHVSVSVLDRSFAMPMTTHVGELQLQFKVKAEFGADEPRVDIESFGVHATDLGVSSGGEKQPWLRLVSLELQEGSLDLAGRQIAAARVAVNGGLVEIARDAHGGLSVLKAMERSPGNEGTHAAPARAGASATNGEPPWHFRIGKVEVDRMAIALREESIAPAVRLDIVDLSAAAEGLSEDLKTEVPAHVRFRVKPGGSFEAGGRVSLVPPTADLHLKLADLALTPAQPFLGQLTNLVLTDGKASLEGRLRYQGDKVAYEGGFAVRKLRLKEAGTDDPILGWQSLSSSRMMVTQERLRVGELALDGLVSKLVIFKDRSVNLARLLKPASKADAEPPAPIKAAKARPYRVDVDRVHISNGEMDFSDLSLALPFGARIHELQGYVIGLSTVPGPPAQLEFGGKVDEYGLARAVGQVNPFDPTGFSDIKVMFRNVEMTALTPYAATFAGRKIESGKLSLDLEYKIKQRQLAGDNRVIMEKLTLGEKVQSPTAMNLPLDLALAVLQDSDGKIDLGLPVSGSLDDPQFSYGQIIWKAIVNVVTKIVSAPFRALGAMLGVNDEKLDRIAFDAGSAELLPPEREKLANLAKVMAKRPSIALAVRVDFDPKADAQAIKELRLRRAVAQDSGRILAEGEDPGPISTTEPATRAAVERRYVKRFGAADLESLQQRYRQANPDARSPNAAGRLVSQFSSVFTAQPKPLSAEESARLKGAEIHGLMIQRLIDEDTVDDVELHALATLRYERIRRELVAQGVEAGRMHAEEPRAHSDERGQLAAALSVATAGKEAAVPPPQPAAR